MLTPVWPDRDSFITINEENIVFGREGNYEKRDRGDAYWFEPGSVNLHNTPYDYLSVIVRKKVPSVNFREAIL